MAKSPDAFRTISEVAEWLGIQAHVLRFWESKFTQVKPIKRAGGRRYYRPADMLLLGGIKKLLHEDGLTIKGVQKILREDGMNHVAALSMPLDELTVSAMGPATVDHAPASVPEPEPEGVVLAFEPLREPEENDDDTGPEPQAAEVALDSASARSAAEPDLPPPPTPAPEPDMPPDPMPEIPDTPDVDPTPEPRNVPPEPDTQPTPEPENIPQPDTDPEIPPQPEMEPEPTTPEPEIPRPRDIGMPQLTPAHEISALPGVLAATFRARRIDSETAAQIRPLLARLGTLRDTMAAQRGRPGT